RKEVIEARCVRDYSQAHDPEGAVKNKSDASHLFIFNFCLCVSGGKLPLTTAKILKMNGVVFVFMREGLKRKYFCSACKAEQKIGAESPTREAKACFLLHGTRPE